MAKGKKRQEDPTAVLDVTDPGWRDGLNGSNLDQLKAKLAEVAKDEEANQASKEADADLADKKAAVKNASLGYSELSKRNRLKTKFLIRNLADAGDEVALSIIQNNLTAADIKASNS